MEKTKVDEKFYHLHVFFEDVDGKTKFMVFNGKEHECNVFQKEFSARYPGARFVMTEPIPEGI